MTETQPTSWSVSEILDCYPRLGVPHFQRGLVWKDEAVSLLLESLYFQTPCGMILLWVPQEPDRQGHPLVEGAKCERFIIDGQQRIRMIRSVFGDAGVDSQTDDDQESPAPDKAPRLWCVDLTSVPKLAGWFGDRESRERIFVRVVDPKQTMSTRYRNNLIPLATLRSNDPELLRPYLDLLRPDNPQVRAEVHQIAAATRAMTENRVFSVRILTEANDRYGLAEVVRLYNRINSAGQPVEAEEKAYASLVRLHPGTAGWLASLFAQLHEKDVAGKPKGVDRDTVLQRRKERNFGFKLYLRTFVQVCNYHFNRSLGANAFSFDLLASRWFQQRFGDPDSAKLVSELFATTRRVLCCLRDRLREELRCDDLQMLPDTTSLTPVLELLIRFPALMEQAHAPVVAYLALRLLMEPDRTQEKTLNLVKEIDRHDTAAPCVAQLRERLAWSEHLSKGLRVGLENARALNDRFVLLLYWLVRGRKARDLSYQNLEPSQRVSLLQDFHADAEVLVDETIEPEKQHLVPASALGIVFGGKGRITTSRHDANNIGNLTFISHKLNFALSDSWMNPEYEAPANRRAHFLEGDVLDAYGKLYAVKQHLTPQHQNEFARFTKVRRDLIQAGFQEWLEKLGQSFAVVDRIEAQKRLFQPDLGDELRDRSYPDDVEDALVALWKQGLLEKRRYADGALVVGVGKRKLKDTFEVRLHPGSRLEVKENGSSAYFRALRDAMTAADLQATTDCSDCGRQHKTPRWLLRTNPASAEATAGVLRRFLEVVKKVG